MSAHCEVCESDLNYDGSCSLCDARHQKSDLEQALRELVRIYHDGDVMAIPEAYRRAEELLEGLNE